MRLELLLILSGCLLSQPKVCADEIGCFRGKYERGLEKPYEAFYGIPYAEPPVGKLRFEDPLPHSGWYGYWDASYPRNDCLQRNVYIASQPVVGSEDCLYLNVYRPLKRKSAKLPVMVLLHGGGFFTFSSKPRLFGPEYFMDNGEVILVTLNYRLGILGFLCSGDEAVKGNFGFKDQQMALKWMASNIEAFGGNPKSITLVGESAGGAAAHLHMMNPVSQALFQQIVLISGCALDPWALYNNKSEPQFRQVARSSGIKNWATASLIEIALQLKKEKAEIFLEVLEEMFIFYEIPPTPVRPCLEGNWEGAFLTEDPKKIWAEGRFSPKPILMSTTRDEGLLVVPITVNASLLKAFNDDIYNLLPIQLGFPPKATPYVMKYYLGDKDYIDETNVRGYYKMFGDRLLDQPIIRTVRQYLQHVDVALNPIYLLEFAFESSVSYAKVNTGMDVNLGVAHADDLFFLFTIPDFFPPFKANSLERKMVDIYVESFVNFAKTGNPLERFAQLTV
ncbi:juvenile hormone esterase-like [Lutzomyia longipalpis]|uniref:juvenile hormone esterase-like n=1 Tax=Lutzomyia longipalpis TaxID=7200 RepID=UPI0024842972|nr:juvenile hormone esterase-like [Lutzomyia longipalpis]